jgi:hypothetical protein
MANNKRNKKNNPQQNFLNQLQQAADQIRDLNKAIKTLKNSINSQSAASAKQGVNPGSAPSAPSSNSAKTLKQMHNQGAKQSKLFYNFFKDKTAIDNVSLFVMRGILDKLSRMAGMTSAFTNFGNPGGIFGLMSITMLHSIFDKLISEIQANNQITKEGMDKGFTNVEARRLLARQNLSMSMLSADNRAEVFTEALDNFLGRSLAENDSRMTIASVLKEMGQDTEDTFTLWSEMKYTSQADAKTQIKTLLDLRESGFRSEAGLDALVKLYRASMQKTKGLTAMLSPEVYDTLQKSITSIAGASKIHAEDFLNFITEVMTTPKEAGMLGFQDTLNRMSTITDVNEMSKAILSIVEKSSEFNKTHFGNRPIFEGGIARDALKNAVGVDMAHYDAMFKTILKYQNQARISGIGGDILTMQRSQLIRQDAGLAFRDLLNKAINFQEGIAGVKDGIDSLVGDGLGQKLDTINNTLKSQQTTTNFNRVREDARKASQGEGR